MDVGVGVGVGVADGGGVRGVVLGVSIGAAVGAAVGGRTVGLNVGFGVGVGAGVGDVGTGVGEQMSPEHGLGVGDAAVARPPRSTTKSSEPTPRRTPRIYRSTTRCVSVVRTPGML